MNHGSLFSGIGAPELAAEWMGWNNIFHCDFNPYCQKLLKQNFPNSTGYANIKDFNATQYRGIVDIISGGFPCQPFSLAGKRKGTDDERHLWPEMLRIIREVQPTWVVGENVAGLVNWDGGLVFDQVQIDLETEGYEVTAFILPAAGVNAPHRRDRIWFIAYSNSCSKRSSRESDQSESKGSNFNDQQGKWGEQAEQHTGCSNVLQPFTNSSSPGLSLSEQIAIEPERGRSKGRAVAKSFETSTWNRWPTQSPICGGDDGVSNRVDRVKALGNSMVPQVVHQIFKAIQAFEDLL
jgi:DNA (cytosine-5)-methyltransferase 1